jgi:hypothetical protein
MQAKRQMEEELIFRGEEYARAIQKYRRKFGVYPSSIDQLVSTNNLRFVRRAYKDPVTGKEFRLITINPDGSVTGSKTFTSNVNTQPLFGNTQTFGQQNPQQPSQGVQNPQQQQQLQPLQQPLQRSQQQVGQPGQQSGFPVGGPQPGFPIGGQQPQLSGLPQQQQQSQQRGQQPNTQQGTGNPVTGSPIGSGGIIGVASDSDKDSIKVYNKRQKYSEWEFIAILGQTGQNPTQGSNPAGANPAGNNPNSPNPSGFNPRGNPANPSSSPFGGPPGSPLGPAGGATMPVQNPFGFGGAPQQPSPQPRK